jgi:hypothetical protein
MDYPDEGVYDSDTGFAHFHDIADLLKREIAYQLSPEHIRNRGDWLASVLAVVELILLFEKNDIGSTIHFRDEKVVQRWSSVFFSVWDGDWQEDNKYSSFTDILDDSEYRKQHRQIVEKMFGRFEIIARHWKEKLHGINLPLLPIDVPLPYFSIARWQKPNYEEKFGAVSFIWQILDYFEKEIVFWLSPEKRAEAESFKLVPIWVAIDVDIMGLISETYHITSGISTPRVRAWRDTTIQIWKNFEEEEGNTLDQTRREYLDTMRAFDRLEMLAIKYPSPSYDKDES